MAKLITALSAFFPQTGRVHLRVCSKGILEKLSPVFIPNWNHPRWFCPEEFHYQFHIAQIPPQNHKEGLFSPLMLSPFYLIFEYLFVYLFMCTVPAWIHVCHRCTCTLRSPGPGVPSGCKPSPQPHKSILDLFVFILYVTFRLVVCHVYNSPRPAEGVISPGATVTEGCEVPQCVRNWT